MERLSRFAEGLRSEHPELPVACSRSAISPTEESSHRCRCGTIIANTLSGQCELPISGQQAGSAGNLASNILAQIDAVHREVSWKHIRDLENLSAKIIDTPTCHCATLSNILERFAEFRNALLTWQIRDQYLLMPTVRQRITAALSGAVYNETYIGEFADLAREAETDHRHLCLLAEGLLNEIENLKSIETCPEFVIRFTELIVDFVKCLRLQFRLEDSLLLTGFIENQMVG